MFLSVLFYSFFQEADLHLHFDSLHINEDCSSLEKVTDTLASLAQPGDLILTVGAGDIFRAGEKLLERA